MLFNSLPFIFLFLPAVVTLFFTANKYFGRNVAQILLVLSSLFFYGWLSPFYVLLILASIVFNYTTGLLLNAIIESKRKIILILGIAANVLLLAYYKYAEFFIDNISVFLEYEVEFKTVVFPVAISFFTFQQIAYLVDVYRNGQGERNILQYLLFISFFPQLIAGPIVYYREMHPQFSKTIFRFSYSHCAIGITFFALGLFKKVVLADNLALYADPVFLLAETGSSIDFFPAWQGALAYTFQIYFDFSGYSDMAIGIARIFGFWLPINFYSPYKAANIIEFWHRWHITLSRFLREYIYFPLGGSRKGIYRKQTNLMVTMLLGGLWHGAGWTFVAWGGLHGLYLIINHTWRSFNFLEKLKVRPYTFFLPCMSYSITFIAVVCSWVFFRAESFSGAVSMVSGLANFSSIAFTENISKDMVYQINLFVICSIIVWLLPNLYQFMGEHYYIVEEDQDHIEKSSIKFKFALKDSVIVAVCFLISLVSLLTVQGAGFIYNDF